jgi:hypothetical protein
VIDVHKLDEMLSEFMEQSRLGGGMYAVVMWSDGRAFIASNAPCDDAVRAMFNNASTTVAAAGPDNIMAMPTMGNA